MVFTSNSKTATHEHIEPGSFLLDAHGEALVLDPGYLSFGEHGALLAPSDHNTVLVNGKGPRNPLTSSFAWPRTRSAHRRRTAWPA